MQRDLFARRLQSAFRNACQQPMTLLYRLLLLALLGWACEWSARAVWSFTIDDAGISYAYAKHIAQGYGPVAAVGGPWIEGYSNPSWVLLLVPFQWLGLSLPLVAKLLGVVLFVLSLGLGAALVTGAEERSQRSLGAAQLCFALGSAACLEIAVWTVAGLENALFSALLLLMAWLDARESEQPGSLGCSGLAGFCLCITRPEGALYVAPLFAIKLVQALRKREPWRQVITTSLLCIAPLVLYHAAHYAVFGDFVPNTYYAKPGSRDWQKGYAYLLTSLADSGVLYTLPLAVLGLIGRPRLKLLLGWYCLAGALFILYSGGDWMPYARFLSLSAPAALVLVAMGVSNLATGLRWLARRRLPREPVLLCLVAGSLWLWWGYQAPRLRDLAKRHWCHFCERVADTSSLVRLGQRAGLSSVSLVTQDFGGPAWLSDEQLYPIDFLGLCDRSVARIRQDRVSGARRGGSVGHDFRFYQYLIHEQPSAPSWIYVPPNFWPLFDLSPEFRGDYYRLDPRLLPRARRDAFFGLHRSELVDYFPPVPSAEFRALGPRFALVGAASFADPTAPAEAESARAVPGSRMLMLVSVVPRGVPRGDEQLALRVEAGPDSVQSAPLALGRGLDGVASQLGDGEPLRFELSLSLPPTRSPSYRVSLGYSGDAQGQRGTEAAGWTFTPIAELEAGAPLPPLTQILPRYPAALPSPLDVELRRLRGPVTLAIEQRRRAGHGAPAESELGRRLVTLGKSLEASGQLSQAYLAYVWATQVDRRQWEALADTVFRLRQTALDDGHILELALLQQYYATGTSAALARLVGYYLQAARPLEAEYFFERRPASAASAEPWPRFETVLSAELAASDAASTDAAREGLGEVARDPLGGGLDFETPSLEGWAGDLSAFSAGLHAGQPGLEGLRGYHGSGILASLQGRKRARGALLSPEFSLDGSVMSLLVGGGSRKRRVGVELLVADKVVRSAYGNDSDFMLVKLWDVSEYQGERARLRVFDQNIDSYVLVDRVLMWR